MKFTMTRTFYLFILCFFSLSLFAQNKPLTKYYDSLWRPTSKDSAFYFTEFVKEDNFYNCYSYWVASKKLNCKSIYADTLFSKPLGLLLRYYENGLLQDSSYFYEDGAIKNTYHYYPNGKLWAHYSYNQSAKKETAEGFDEHGNSIRDFVFLKEADFPGGAGAWTAYLTQNLKTKVPIKNGAPAGTYQVIINFVVDKNGGIRNIEAKTNLGYGMEEEAIRVIRKSPKWSPLILLGKTENAFRRQPITFVVANKTK